LTYTCDDVPGIRRRRVGLGFAYFDPSGARIRDRAVIDRIRRLAIPPAYTDVWICVDPHGHLQATGRDARRRKQYRYHAAWRVLRDHDKFARLAEFGRRLPRLRRRVRSDLALPGLPRDKVLAIVASLLGKTMGRVGNREYLRENGSYGLTTLRDRHLALLRGGRARLRFRGKSGQINELTIDDARLTRLLRRCQQLPGQQLFQYVDDDGVAQPIDSGMVNDYVQRAAGEAFTAKDFRTWGATALAVERLVRTPLPRTERQRAAEIVAVIKEIASVLGNTPAVCRKSYVDPIVFDAWRDGRLARDAARVTGGALRRTEALLLRLLAVRTKTRATIARMARHA
ncbi:MAG TPA: DNA topoisomerase IB, partial [Rhodanobacteraceae bacterium]|nr:DNA topoisomerase IB [Rhodanobacteraceae bacterium]